MVLAAAAVFMLMSKLPAQEPALQSNAAPTFYARQAFLQQVWSSSDSVALTGGAAEKSTTLAMALSAVFPGGGQIYNGKWWKVPIVWGAGGFFVEEWSRNNRHYNDYYDQFARSLQTSPPYGDTRTQALRDYYRDQRDSFAWYFGILYALQILDAYVDASLSGFDVGPDLGGSKALRVSVSVAIR